MTTKYIILQQFSSSHDRFSSKLTSSLLLFKFKMFIFSFSF